MSSLLTRVLETEAMDSLEEAVDYNSMDHGEVNRAFVADLLACGPAEGEMLDLGTGTALIPIELCRQHPTARILAVDVAEHMLEVGQDNISHAGLEGRIRLERIDAKRLPFADGQFATVISNSIVHHVPEPRSVLDEAWRVAARGGLLFFRDLFRPMDEPTVLRLVQTYAAGANAHQKQMLADSFHAALTVEEVQALVAAYGQGPQSVRASSDRHWTWIARKT